MLTLKYSDLQRSRQISPDLHPRMFLVYRNSNPMGDCIDLKRCFFQMGTTLM
ncbi:hypothetical protein DPMN_181293 [Dreissena polymorpha]|uniref:Uncharacterized protein n=1 Tax=Dreissena polymorpha TaxID=45954 RepID=A0A9D4I1H0_DREPO|nr:hypothetical protein DPMN_181293 [Dreissena polymorpha]